MTSENLTQAGVAFGRMVMSDVEALVRARKNAWLGVVEWRVDHRGVVEADLGGVFGGRRLPAGRTLPELAVSVDRIDEGEDDESLTVAQFYVRLEPSVSLDLCGGVARDQPTNTYKRVRRVFNLNNVGMHEDLCGRGFFKGLLRTLETWIEEGSDGFCNCLMVQNVANPRLLRHLTDRPGWRDPLNSEDHTRVRFSESRTETVQIA